MTSGALMPGVEIDSRPAWSVALRYQNRDQWRRLLRPVVALNAARYGVDAPVVRRRGIQVSMRVTLPLAEQERFREFTQGGMKGSAVLDYAGFQFGFMPAAADSNSSEQ